MRTNRWQRAYSAATRQAEVSGTNKDKVQGGEPDVIAGAVTLEMHPLDGLSREQLIELLMEQRSRLSLPLTQECLEEQTAESLRILVLASRLLYLVRKLNSRSDDKQQDEAS
jgi:hypothetical protein